MSSFPSVSLAQRASQKQSMKLSQTMRLGQQQRMALSLLAMPAAELRGEIYAAAERNPALEIAADEFQDGGEPTPSRRSVLSDYGRYARTTSAGIRASDDFQAALESNADERTSLSDHLVHQIDSMELSDAERKLCTMLAQNLNSEGHHILAPISLLDRMDPRPGEAFLGRCLSIVQRLDPVGVCVTNTEHSLLVQARDRGDAPEAALFILDGHFSFLDPPVPEKIARKANRFLSERGKMAFGAEEGRTREFSADEMARALAYIRTLDPRPAREFGASGANFVSPDVFVEEADAGELGGDGPLRVAADGSVLVLAEGGAFRVRLAGGQVPSLRVSEEFAAFRSGAEGERARAEDRFARESVAQARAFIDGVEFRQATLVRAAAEVVRAQAEFFRRGPRFLAPLRQKDVAGAVGVHESTVSRMANGKFLSCAWGVFPMSHFFTNAVNEETVRRSRVDALVGGEAAPTSREGVKIEIARILEEHSGGKPLSDSKIAGILAERGITIARRTVAKYRAELNVASSFGRG